MLATRRGERGQGSTEYIIIVALVAIAAIGVVTAFGDEVRQMTGASADALAGQAETVNGKSKPRKGAKSPAAHVGVTDFAADRNPDPVHQTPRPVKGL